MHDRAGEAAYNGHALGLEDFAQVVAIELAKAPADFLHHQDRRFGKLADEFVERTARNKIDGCVAARGSASGTGLLVDHGHLTKNFARRQRGEDLAVSVLDFY